MKTILIGMVVSMMLLLGPQAFACDKGGGHGGGHGGGSSGGGTSGGGSGAGTSGGASSGGGSSSAGSSVSAETSVSAEGPGSGGGPYVTDLEKVIAKKRDKSCYGILGTTWEMCTAD